MLENHLYNLFLQMTQEHKSLWRVKNEYKKDAENCATCKSFWEKMERDKENHVQELERLIRNHLK